MGGRRYAYWVVAVLFLAGCPQHGVIGDGTSISHGPSNRGRLINPARLPVRGEGYWIPPRWAQRGLRYGTDELVSLIVYTGRRLRQEHPRSVVGVADLSLQRGGPSPWHRSHQSGRDVDLLFLATDARGQPVRLSAMVSFAADGTAFLAPGTEAEQVVHFDVARNWLLVRTLISSPIARIQWMFIADHLKQKLLDHARATGEPAELVQQAGFLLHQPGDALPHDDHLHVRIFCAASDRVLGCRDRGILRWVKKDYKYDPVLRPAVALVDSFIGDAMLESMPAMFVLGSLSLWP